MSDIDPVLIAATAGAEVEGDVLPNGRPVVAREPGGCCEDCVVPVLTPGDCHECLNSGLAGPYPESMGLHFESLPATLVDLPGDETPGRGWVMPCHLCHPEAYPGGFPGLRSPIDTWLIPPGPG